MTRNAAFDLGRLLAVFGIVMFHTGAPGAAWGYGGLPFFLLLIGLFVLPTAERTPTGPYLRTRARRLLVPWLVWSAIYAALMAAQALVNGRPPLAEAASWMLLTGPALHLWFLPFAFVAGGLLHALARAVLARGPRGAALLGWAGAAVAFLTLGLSQAGPWPIPLAQWLFAVPALGLGLLWSTERGPLALLGTAAVLLGAWALGWRQDLLPLAVGLAGLGLCLAVRLPQRPWTRPLADLALIVYLAHPLVLVVLVWATGLRLGTLAAAALIFALSLALALAWPRLLALPRLLRPHRAPQTPSAP